MLTKSLSLLSNTGPGRFISSGLKIMLESALATLSKDTHGYSIAMTQEKSQPFVRTGMIPDPYYRGSVIVNKGEYRNYNGRVIGCAIHHVSREWICLVEFYEGSDVYAVPFEYLEKIDIDRIS